MEVGCRGLKANSESIHISKRMDVINSGAKCHKHEQSHATAYT